MPPSRRRMPNQVVLMREALELAANETATEEEREMGLLNLQELVSDIDNACARPPLILRPAAALRF
eukprot:7383501-Prymnesium_polylepis.1